MSRNPCFVSTTSFRFAPLSTGHALRSATCGNRLMSPIRMSSQVHYGRIQHAGVLVKDMVASKKFYMEVFGMLSEDDLRNSKLPFKGSFMKAGSSQIHLMELPSPDPEEGRPEHGGRDRHVAVTVRDLEPLIASLEKHNRVFTFSRSGRRAVFTRDPDMNAIEFIEDSSA